MTHEEESSSICKKSWIYDVFLSFRGEDTRYGFTGNLYNALHQRGIYTFIDHEKLKRGEEISPTLLSSIKKSRVSIVVFSKNYADSGWCLDELVHIMKCKSQGQWIHPVFYNIDPSDIRHQKGDVGEALAVHEKKPGMDKERMNRWRSAMRELANLSGSHFKFGYEYEFIEKIIKDVSRNLDRDLLFIADHPVGLNSRIEKVISLMEEEAEYDVKMVGLYGLGGIGKTTLARALYNQISDQFECKTFLSNVRETSTKEGLIHLQKKLLADTLGDKDITLRDVKEGMERIQHGLYQKKVLIVLDDVDHLEQLELLVGGSDGFGKGSTIVVTTRDMHLLIAHDINLRYEINALDHEDALELFCWSAFKKDKPNEGYEEISERAVQYGSNLPLALKIIGSDLIGKGMADWKSTLQKYERVPNKDIQNILRISYDNLDDNEKQIFLDIACFFKGMALEACKKVLEGFGFHPDSGIHVLQDKSLVILKDDKTIWMHNIVEEMGREIVRQESPKDPGKRSRLWFYEDVLQVLKENSGTEKIEGIMLNLPEEEKVDWSGEGFEKMKKLRLLVIDNAYFSKGPKHLPNDLRVLDWKNYPLPSLPVDFDPTKLVIVNLPHSPNLTLNVPLKNKLDYKSYISLITPKVQFQKCENLIFMDLSHCASLRNLPDLSGVPNLVELYLDHCTNLESIHHSVGLLTKLVKLSAKGCDSLNSFPLRIYLPSLESLILRKCSTLVKFPEVVKKMEKIRIIDVGETGIKRLPTSFSNLVGLEKLCLRKCTFLSALPSSFLLLKNLKELDMGNCPKLRKCLKMFKRFDGESISSSLSTESSLDTTQSELVSPNDSPEISPSNSGLDLVSTSESNESFSVTSQMDMDSRSESFESSSVTEQLDLVSPNESSESSVTSHDLDLVLLNVEDCNLSDEHLLIILTSFPGLTKLKLSRNKFVTLPARIKELLRLESLQLDFCTLLQEIQAIPQQLQFITATFCKRLTTESSTMLLRQVLHEIPKLEVQVPGREVPDWFDHRSKGGSVSFWVRRKFPVIAVCSVYGGPGGLETYVQFEVCLLINGVRVYTYKDSFSLESRHHVWLHDLRAYMPPQQWQTLDKYLKEDWNQVEISFAMSIGTVKCCGVHVYKKESNMEDVQFTLPNAQTALVPYQSEDVVVENEDEVSCTEDEKIDNTLQLLKYFRIHKTTDKEKSIMVYYDIDETKMWARGTATIKEKASQDDKQTNDEDKGEEKIEQKKTFGKKSLSFAYRMSEHVRLRSKLSETVTSTLNFGAAFIVMGGRDNMFKNTFGLKEEEELLNASHCYKYTTVAPIPGTLFISTEKVAFCSEDFDNKLLILTRNIKDVTLSRNAKDPSQKYIEIVTEDKSKYQFKGFLRYESAFRNLRKAIIKNKEKMAMKTNEATDDQLGNDVVMEAVHGNESQSIDDQAHKVSDPNSEAEVIPDKEKEKVSETMMNTLSLGSKLVQQSGMEKISFLRKKLPSPFKSS
ncbi:Disease resistance-like protein [Quillaja saponaria]|uniref:ADP-ribosyl cyclase/cyclic ADP-ribose hydrolase n=1 Tax=Quillaja saponaria TaxID=32244 RepID=A0AAD7Q5P7_QUISA|nr:Disease resistance-like protein [Quillaja saponaria]